MCVQGREDQAAGAWQRAGALGADVCLSMCRSLHLCVHVYTGVTQLQAVLVEETLSPYSFIHSCISQIALSTCLGQYWGI